VLTRDDRGVLSERLASQLLSGPPARGPAAVAQRLLAVQAQDPRGARLAVRARSAGTTAADVDRALSAQRSLVVSWLNRGTLHLVRREDYFWLHALTAPPTLTGTLRRLTQEQVSPDAVERGVAVIERALAAEGPLTRSQLGERLQAAGVRTQGQALIHLIALSCLRGKALRGPIVGRDHAYVLVRDWLGEPPAVARDTALAELARRYLAGHAPAADRDLARWSGLPLRDARAGLHAIAPELRTRADGSLELRRRKGTELLAALPPPRLLGPFEPSLLGWTSREPLLGRHERVVTVNGLFRAFAMVEGRAVATWTMPAGEVVLEPFEPLPPAVTRALAADADAVRLFLERESTRR
jgi:hypothetical protein